MPVAMELGSDPVVFRSGDQAALDEGNKGGTPIPEPSNPTVIIAAVAVVVILAGGVVGGILFFL